MQNRQAWHSIKESESKEFGSFKESLSNDWMIIYANDYISEKQCTWAFFSIIKLRYMTKYSLTSY